MIFKMNEMEMNDKMNELDFGIWNERCELWYMKCVFHNAILLTWKKQITAKLCNSFFINSELVQLILVILYWCEFWSLVEIQVYFNCKLLF